MIKPILLFWNLFQEGQRLTNSREWKNRQNIANFLTAIVGITVLGFHVVGNSLNISYEIINTFSIVLATVVSIVNIILTTITTKKIGFKKRTPV